LRRSSRRRGDRDANINLTALGGAPAEGLGVPAGICVGSVGLARRTWFSCPRETAVRYHLELQPNPTQKLPASRGSRRQYQSHGSRRGAGGGAGGGGRGAGEAAVAADDAQGFHDPGGGGREIPHGTPQ